MRHTTGRAIRTTALTIGAIVAFSTPVAAQQRDQTERRTADFRWSRALQGGSLVKVHNINGDVRVTASTSREVEVVGIVRGSGRAAEDLAAEVVETRDGIIVCVIRRNADDECDEDGYHSRGRNRNDSWDRASMDLELRIPADIRIAANSVSGNVSIAGARGDVRANSVSGDVTLEGLRASSVSANSVSGDIEVRIDQLTGDGSLEFKTVSGDVVIELPREVDADLSMSTVSGNMDSDFQMTIGGRMSRRRIEARIGRGGRELDITTVSGDVRLKATRS